MLQKRVSLVLKLNHVFETLPLGFVTCVTRTKISGVTQVPYIRFLFAKNWIQNLKFYLYLALCTRDWFPTDWISLRRGNSNIDFQPWLWADVLYNALCDGYVSGASCRSFPHSVWLSRRSNCFPLSRIYASLPRLLLFMYHGPETTLLHGGFWRWWTSGQEIETKVWLNLVVILYSVI